MVVKYITQFQIKNEGISRLNQVQIYKKMILPCDLVGFLGWYKIKDAREKKKKVVWSGSIDLIQY